MRHKLAVVVLATLMTAAGASEASRQFGEWKSAAAEWASASILGNVLVFAGGASDTSAAPRQTVLVADAHASSACKGERSPAAAAPSGRPASQQKAAAGSAKTEKSLSETTPEARDSDALAHSLVAARDQKMSERIVVKLVPRIGEIAETLNEQLGEQTTVRTAFRTRATVTASGGAEAARAVAELKKLGLRKVYVRVAQAKGGARAGDAFRAFAPNGLPVAFEFTSPAEPRGASLEESAQEVPRGAAVPVDQQDFNCFFKSPGSRR